VTHADPLVANPEVREEDDRPRHLHTTAEAWRLSRRDATSPPSGRQTLEEPPLRLGKKSRALI
jgi:hypothetical protein